MEFERATMAQIAEIQRLIQSGISDRQIAKALKCRRSLIAGIRLQQVTPELISQAKRAETQLPPGWTLTVDWPAVERDIREGHQLKRIWEEVAQARTSYSNFFKYIKVRFASLLDSTVTLREFKPGEHCEVDYAGDKIEWIDVRSGEIHQAHVFIGILCFSQKMFAIAHENEKKPNWLDAHRRMFEFFGGCPRVVVPDQLKNGVIKSHRYDPDLNQDYVELAKHYDVVILPARSRHPRDKAFVENAVGILMRYFRFIYRRRTFTSLSEVNQALMEALHKINGRIHTRFKISREERFRTLEKPCLKALPVEPYAIGEWKKLTLHPDCTVHADGNYYSAPHIYRHKELRVKMSYSFVEIYLDLERIAIHDRARGRVGERVIKNEHLPDKSRAYREATPQMILSQARFSNLELHKLIDELFIEDALAHLRRAQGMVRKAYSTIQGYGRESSAPWIDGAVANMRRFNQVRVRSFEGFIKAEMKKTNGSKEDRTIVRKSGNPMVRGHGTRVQSEETTVVPEQTQLRLI
jgi:transposase